MPVATAEVERITVDSARAWLVVAGAFIANAVGFGIIYSFTVFFPFVLEEFGGSRGAISVIASVEGAVMLGSGAFIGRLTDRFGARRMIFTGSLLVAAGLLLASISRALWQVYLSYGLLLGLGVGCSFLPSNTAAGQWFLRRRGLATGIAVAGSGVGAIVTAPIAERLISSYDWRIAMRFIALVGFMVLLVAAGLVRSRAQRHRTSVLSQMRRDPIFRTIYLSAFVGSYGYWIPFVHIVPFARDQGVSVAEAALLVSVMGAGNIVGRVVLGAAADRVGRLRIFQLSLAAMAVAIFLWPFARGPSGLVPFAAAYGFFAGAFISLLFALTADYFGIERLPGVTGLLNTSAALGTLLGAPVSGAIFDATGSYTLAILIAGAAMAVSAAVALSLPHVQKHQDLAG